MESLTYKRAGVDIVSADRMLDKFSEFLRSRPQDPNVIAGIGGFASCYDISTLARSMEQPLLVSCCDGVGTKIKLALEWGYVDGLGQDLVAMNVNDMLCCGARPIAFLDYFACGKLKEEFTLNILKGVHRGCELAECTLVGGETAEMPGMYSGDDFDLAGFAIGLVDKKNSIGPHKVRPGDRLLALASNGPHSNGFSLIRQLVEKNQIDPSATPPFEGPSWKETLLKPTTIYVRALKSVLSSLNALAHITGSGLYGNLPRVLPNGTLGVLSHEQWRMPPLFEWMQHAANLSREDLLTTLNCGVGMVAVCSPQNVETVAAALRDGGQPCWEIGSVGRGNLGEPAEVVWE